MSARRAQRINLMNLQRVFSNRVARAAAPTLLALGFAPTASAQFTFSIDFLSRSVNSPDGSGAGLIISPGQLLTPQQGQPGGGQGGGAPIPIVFVGGGIASGASGESLNIQSHDFCDGTPAGQPCPYDIDALSFGMDAPVLDFVTASLAPGQGGTAGGTAPGPAPFAHFLFSVDLHAVGVPGVSLEPNVESENRLVGGVSAGDAAADIFADFGLGIPPLDDSVTGPGSVGFYDGDGLRSSSTLFTYPGLGLIEPTLATAEPLPSTGDDLDAFDADGVPFPGTAFPIYYSMDSFYEDPKDGDLAGTAFANGFEGGDVIVTPTSTAAPVLYADALLLGLDQGFPGEDDLDALALAENGIPGYQVSTVLYDWLDGTSDMLLFSVRRGSAIIGALDSIFGIPIEECDILVPPVLGGNGNPGIFVAGERLGLATKRAADPCGDDLDGLDHCLEKKLLAHDYCFGDGGLTPGCTSCPCGNDVPAGTQSGCRNSAGTGATLIASGFACVSADTLRFEMKGGTASTFGILAAGVTRLPMAGACLPGSGVVSPPLDGLRCIGGSLLRMGTRMTNAMGDIGVSTPGWGPPNGPPGGLIAGGAFLAGTARQFQVFYREDITLGCMRGQNTSSAVQVVFTP